MRIGQLICLCIVAMTSGCGLACNSTVVRSQQPRGVDELRHADDLPDLVAVGGIQFIRIPTGSRLIGTNLSVANTLERPAVKFVLDYPAYFMKTELTRGQYASLLGRPLAESDKKWSNNPKWVIWDDIETIQTAIQLILNEQIGGKWIVRLPFEAEWEYAAMANFDGLVEFVPELARDRDEYWRFRERAWYAETVNTLGPSPVASKSPNAFGLYDMMGNYCEWVLGDPDMNRNVGFHVLGENVEVGEIGMLKGGDIHSDISEMRTSVRRVEHLFGKPSVPTSTVRFVILPLK